VKEGILQIVVASNGLKKNKSGKRKPRLVDKSNGGVGKESNRPSSGTKMYTGDVWSGKARLFFNKKLVK
jgi:hypothetical protein